MKKSCWTPEKIAVFTKRIIGFPATVAHATSVKWDIPER
jgi:hypothetical protein